MSGLASGALSTPSGFAVTATAALAARNSRPNQHGFSGLERTCARDRSRFVSHRVGVSLFEAAETNKLDIQVRRLYYDVK